MSGRNQKNKQRGQSAELLSELHSIRDLLGGDALGDIPLLDQIAEAGQHPAQTAAPKLSPRPAQEPLDESDLPILFSPVDEAPDEEITAELSEAEWELLRPLQELPGKTKTGKAQNETEQQPGLFDTGAPAAENPFLPAHIRARLTGGKVPRAEESPPVLPPPQQQAEPEAGPEADQQQQNAEVEPAPAQAPQQNAAKAEAPTARPMPENQRQQLIDRLVAKQLPELERQLRERVAQMIDELEAKR